VVFLPSKFRTDIPVSWYGKLTRRQLLALGLPLVAAGTLGTAVGRGFEEAQGLTVKKIVIPIAQLPPAFDGFVIAHLSDFHYHPIYTAKPIVKGIREANKLNPDVVVLTGDFVTIPAFGSRRRARAIDTIQAQAEPCAELLSQLRPGQGIYAVLGNHDQGSQPAVVTESLQNRGIRVLRNQSVSLERNGSRLWFAGVDDVLEGADNLLQAISGIPRRDTIILLAHEPDIADDVAAESPVSVQLSGHSHGGQIRLPWTGPPYLPELARRYPWGLRKVGDLSLYTNCGLGTFQLPIRLNCPPEVTLVRLVRAPA